MVVQGQSIAAFSLGHLTLGRLIIAAFMVALLLGPRRWMMWASAVRGRGATRRPSANDATGSAERPAASDDAEGPPPPD